MSSDPADLFLAAIRNSRSDDAGRLLREHPAIAEQSIYAAAGAADLPAVKKWLARYPALANVIDERYRWTALGYACWSHAFKASERAAADNLEIVRVLLDAGADPNVPVLSQDEESVPLPVLFLACRSHQPPVVRLLLERGANANDAESIYHGAQDGHIDCLELLLAHGADLSSRCQPWNNTPLYYLAGHHNDRDGAAPWLKGFRWLLEHGADPTVTNYKTEDTPLHQIARVGTSVEAASLLLEHGADPLAKRADGRTPYECAVRSGSTAIVKLLEEHMTQPPVLSVVDRFIGACLAADESQVRALLAEHPNLLSTMSADDLDSITRAASSGLSRSLGLMASVGFDIARESPEGGTPLHWAAWHGRPDAVRTLVDLGAPINFRDKTYGSSPVAWAAHGSRFCRPSDDEYCAIVEMLLDLNPDYSAAINQWGQAPNYMGSSAVSAVFKRRGFGGSEAPSAPAGDGDSEDNTDD